MNKLFKKIISATLLSALTVPYIFASPAIPQNEKAIAATIQKEALNSYRNKSTIKKIKSIKNQIHENEKYINKLEETKTKLERKLEDKIYACDDLRIEIDECPYYNCHQCNELKNKIKRLQNIIKDLKSEIKNKERKLTIAKEKRTKLDGDLAVLLQIQEAENV